MAGSTQTESIALTQSPCVVGVTPLPPRSAAGVALLVADGLTTDGIAGISSLGSKTDTATNNINNLSTNSTLEISNLNAASSTLFTNLNSLSTNSTLEIRSFYAYYDNFQYTY